MEKRSAIIVGAEGSIQSKIAIIGEAPGRDEVVTLRPFSGPAGRELNRFLNATRIQRTDCYITNVVKERPPYNDISVFIKFPDPKKKDRTVITSSLYDEYEDELYDELLATKANVFVVAGRIPLYALARQWEILKYRGSILECEIKGRKLKVIPIIHPAAVLPHRGKYEWRRFIAHDLLVAREESKFPEVIRPKRDLRINATYDEVLAYIEYCSRAPIVSFDIEVIYQEISHISISPSASESMSISFLWNRTNNYSSEEEVDIWIALADLLQNPNILKLVHNGYFDSEFVFRKYGIRPFPIDCTFIQHSILYPELPRTLGFLCSIYTKEPYFKDEGKVWKTGIFDDEDFSTYNAKDSVVLHEIHKLVGESLEKRGNTEAYRLQTSLLEALVYLMSKGIRLNVEGMRAYSIEVGKKLEVLRSQIEEATEGSIDNPKSPMQVAQYFYVKKGIKPYLKNKKPTTDVDALKRLAKPTSTRRAYPEADLILEHRYLAKLKGTYLDMRIDPDGRIRTSFNPGRTVSSRLASSKDEVEDKGANLQNQHNEMKQFFLADEGYLGLRMDLVQAENMIVAYIAPEPSQIDAFERGIDLHALTASYTFDMSVEDIIAEHKANVYCSLGNGQQSRRFWGKKGNHGVNYGEGYKKFALLNGLTETEAKGILHKIHVGYPGIGKYHNWVDQKIRMTKTLTNCFGRTREFTGELNHDTFRAGYDWIPQSSVGYKINRDGLLYIYNNQDIFGSIELQNQVHDDIRFQVPLSIGYSKIAEMIMLIRDKLQTSMNWKGQGFIIPTELEFGFNLKDVKEVKLSEIDSVTALATQIHQGVDHLRDKI